jgi:uncharacterized protein YcbK (DUF882 family)
VTTDSIDGRYFGSHEFACHDGTDVPLSLYPNLKRLIQTLDIIRGEWGEPIHVTSGYRTPAWNARVSGAGQSRHMTAEAADIRPRKLGDIIPLQHVVLKLFREDRLPGLGGLGTYHSWLHVDVRTRKPPEHLARWQGSGLGSERP